MWHVSRLFYSPFKCNNIILLHVCCIVQIPCVCFSVHPRILSTSGCVQSDVLTCVCISEGFPLPTIKWPLFDTHTEYSFTTNFSNHAVNISITVSVKDLNYTTVECISRNDIGEVKENLNVTRKLVEQKPKGKCWQLKPLPTQDHCSMTFSLPI